MLKKGREQMLSALNITRFLLTCKPFGTTPSHLPFLHTVIWYIIGTFSAYLLMRFSFCPYHSLSAVPKLYPDSFFILSSTQVYAIYSIQALKNPQSKKSLNNPGFVLHKKMALLITICRLRYLDP